MKKKSKNKEISKPSFFICPVCGRKGFSVKQYLDKIPYFGEVLETFAKCKYCSYKTHDILPIGEKDYPKKHKIKISSEEDLNKRVVKSKYCSIKIPELDLKITPGPSSEAYISNIEGVLDRIYESLKKMGKLKKKEMQKKLNLIEKAKSGNAEITIIFKDSTQQSAIIKSEKVK